MKHKFLACLFLGILSVSSFAFAVTGGPEVPKTDDEKLAIAREQIAQDAAFIRQVNNDPTMTPDQKKSAIAEFLKKQNEKVR